MDGHKLSRSSESSDNEVKIGRTAAWVRMSRMQTAEHPRVPDTPWVEMARTHSAEPAATLPAASVATPPAALLPAATQLAT